jgi:multimeric flavodoxin WrbA
MSTIKPVLGLVGSPNKAGRTSELVSAALAGAVGAGALTELIQMSEHVPVACKDCVPWVCAANMKCTYPDEGFEFLSSKIAECGGLVLGTPVYWGDTSAMVRYLFIKLCRIFARQATLKGLPAVGIVIAGGSGNGLTTGLKPVYHFFRAMQIRPLVPVPATRFDFADARSRAEEAGARIGRMVDARVPFESQEACWMAYDRLPYIGENRVAERRLLAALALQAVPDAKRRDIEGDLARADILAASGQALDSLAEITRVYNSCLKAIGQ